MSAFCFLEHLLIMIIMHREIAGLWCKQFTSFNYIYLSIFLSIYLSIYLSIQDWRGGRGAGQNIIPASTGAAKVKVVQVDKALSLKVRYYFDYTHVTQQSRWQKIETKVKLDYTIIHGLYVIQPLVKELRSHVVITNFILLICTILHIYFIYQLLTGCFEVKLLYFLCGVI